MKKNKIQLSDEMVEKLAGISDGELLDDYVAAREDMTYCRQALGAGIVTYGIDPSIPFENAPIVKTPLKRLMQNCGQRAVIRAELERRGTINVIDLDWLKKSSDLELLL